MNQKIKQSCPSDRLFNSYYGVKGVLEKMIIQCLAIQKPITQTLLTEFSYHSGLIFPSPCVYGGAGGVCKVFFPLFSATLHQANSQGPFRALFGNHLRDSSDLPHRLPFNTVFPP